MLGFISGTLEDKATHYILYSGFKKDRYCYILRNDTGLFITKAFV
jgi:hypothetical protein